MTLTNREHVDGHRSGFGHEVWLPHLFTGEAARPHDQTHSGDRQRAPGSLTSWPASPMAAPSESGSPRGFSQPPHLGLTIPLALTVPIFFGMGSPPAPARK